VQFRPQEEGGAPRSPFVDQYLPLRANVEDGVFIANVRSAIARGLPALRAADAHSRHAVIVGGGPSLGAHVETVRRLASGGAAVFALNGTADWLRSHGIEPDYHVFLDARPHMARFVSALARAHYLVASQCAPETFDKLPPGRVTLWHPAVADIGDVAPPNSLMIGGGTTVGLQAMVIAYAMGYRTEHLVGFDSCYSGPSGHAYAQPENDGEAVIEVVYAGRKFLAAPWMVRQADEYRHVLVELTQADCEIWMYGDGLIPYIHRSMINPPHPSAYCYDFTEAPASWDFSEWLIEAESDRIARGAPAPLRVAFALGPKGGFRDDNLPWTPEQRQRFLDTTMRPMLALVGAEEYQAAWNGRRHHYYCFKALGERAKRGEKLAQFSPTEAAVKAVREAFGNLRPLVITLREAGHWVQRNSNVEAWCAFARAREADGYPVVFVRDTEKAEVPLEGFVTSARAATDVDFRCALYASALCNFGVANGPMSLAFFGGLPYLMFKPLSDGWANNIGTREWWRDNLGVPFDGQFAWSTPRQRIVWKDDTLESIEAAWAEWLTIKE